MKNINLYIIAFFAVLIKTLILTMSFQEAGVLVALLLKLSYDSFLNSKKSEENKAPLETELKKQREQIVALQNAMKLANFRK